MNESKLVAWLDETGGCTPVHRPLVTLSYAQSLDGCISKLRGKPTEISGDVSLRATHIIRSRHDGILVGIKTVISDDPRLSVRLVNEPSPRPIVIDTHLNMPLTSKLLNSERSALIFCAKKNSESRKKLLGEAGAEIIEVKTGKTGHLHIPDILYGILDSGIPRLMVEGGGEMIAAFMNSKLWDRAAITIAPKWLAGYTPRILPDLDPVLTDIHWIPAGDDIMCLGRRAE